MVVWRTVTFSFSAGRTLQRSVQNVSKVVFCELKNTFLSATILLSTKGRRLYTVIPKEGGIAIARNALPRIVIKKAVKSFYIP